MSDPAERQFHDAWAASKKALREEIEGELHDLRKNENFLRALGDGQPREERLLEKQIDKSLRNLENARAKLNALLAAGSEKKGDARKVLQREVKLLISDRKLAAKAINKSRAALTASDKPTGSDRWQVKMDEEDFAKIEEARNKARAQLKAKPKAKAKAKAKPKAKPWFVTAGIWNKIR